MKIAVCISGAFNTRRSDGDLVYNNKLIKSKFTGADFYYATWDKFKPEFKKQFPDDNCEYFPEPIMNYHPYHDIPQKDHISNHYTRATKWAQKGGQKRTDWTSHHTKQILIHSWLIDKIKQNYDIIVRARFDTFIHDSANFALYLEDTFSSGRANCFGASKWKLFNNLTRITNASGTKFNHWIIDQLIIHTADAIDTDSVNLLHKQKMLHAAEHGWYQVISMPHGSNHRNYSGWVNPDWSILDEFYTKNKI